MSSTLIETPHTDAIHDCQTDYYGVLVATGSSDRTICIREVGTDSSASAVVDTLQGHDGAVWMVSWAHPRFGTLLASASYDGKVIVWGRNGQSRFESVYVNTAHTGSVNSISWAPQGIGLRLASASSDGTVREVRCEEGAWGDVVVVGTHAMGALSVSWSPVLYGSSTTFLCTGGCDARIRLWSNSSEEGRTWTLLSQFECKDWIRDVAFEPTMGNVLAAISQDKFLHVFPVLSNRENEEKSGLDIDKHSVSQLEATPWRLSWSPQGNVVAVTLGETVCLYRESTDPLVKEWSLVNTLPL